MSAFGKTLRYRSILSLYDYIYIHNNSDNNDNNTFYHCRYRQYELDNTLNVE